MKISSKLVLGFGTCIALVWACVAVSLHVQGRVHARVEALEGDIVPGALAMSGMETSASIIAHAAMDYIYYGKQQDRKEMLAGVERLRSSGQVHLAHEAHVGQEEKKAARMLVARIEGLASAAGELARLKDQGTSIDELAAKEEGDLHATLEELTGQLAAHKAVHMREMDEAVREINRAHAWSIWALVGVAVLLSLLGCSISVSLTRSIAGPLVALRAGCDAVAKGDLEHRVGMRSADEFGRLSQGFDRMTSSLKEVTVSRDALEREVAERKRAEAALEHSVQEWQGTFDAVQDMVMIIDEDYRIVQANAATREAFSVEEVIGRHCYELFHGLSERPASCPSCKVFSCAKAAHLELHEEHLGNRWFDVRAYPANAKDGTVKTIVHVVRDITERKRAEERSRKLAKVVEQSTEGMAVADLEGRLTFVNRAWIAMHGYESGDDLVGRNLSIFHSRKQLERDVVPFNRKVMENGSNGGEVGHVRKDGTAFPTLMATSLLRDGTGRPMSLAGIAKDISEEKKAQDRLKRTLKDLERSNRDLEQFAYVASHDLQEPLRMVSSYTQLLARRYKDALDKDANEFIGYAVDGAKRMRELLEGLLALSRVGRRGKPFARTECRDVLASVLKNLEILIGENDATITCNELPTIMADEGQMAQLFQNLIANAIRYRGEAAPEVRVSAERRNGNWEFSVRDNGIGIAPEHYERIFEMFQRLHGLGEYPGTGMGLAVCKRIVERHGGNMWVESEPGKGSTFRFTIPAASGDSGSTRPTG